MERWPAQRVVTEESTGAKSALENIGSGVPTGSPVRFGSIDDVLRLQPVLVHVQDTGASDALVTIKHGLGRVPIGIRVINTVLQSAADFAWYRLASDDDWTDTFITLRFRVSNAALLLEVF